MVRIENMYIVIKKIIFKHTTNRNISFYSKKLSILIQAIKAIGSDKINDNHIKKLALFADGIKDELNDNPLKVPFWIREVLEKIQEISNK